MRKILAAAALAALVAAAPAQATNGMRMIGFGPVQTSMGGVGVGAGLDASAVLTNPAAMTELSRRLDVGLSWFKPTVDYKAENVAIFPVVGQPGTTIDSERGGSPIPAIAFVTPLGGDLTFGVGLFGVAGMGVDYPQNLYGGVSYTSYLQGRVAPGLAWRLGEYFSMGLTFNAMVAQMKFDVASGFGQVPHDTATALGAGFTAGFQIRPTKRLTIGLAWESPSVFQNFEFDVPPHNVPNPQPPPAAFPVPGGKDKLDFDQPQVATVGFSWLPVDALLLAADVEWIRWSETNGKDMPRYVNDTQLTGAQPFNLSWKDQWVFKVGVQVAPAKSLRIRAGWNYGKQPLDAGRAFENIVFPAIAEHHVTGGLGWDVTPSLTVNVGGMFAPQAKLTGSNPGFPPDGQVIASYETRMSQYSIDGGVSWKF